MRNNAGRNPPSLFSKHQDLLEQVAISEERLESLREQHAALIQLRQKAESQLSQVTNNSKPSQGKALSSGKEYGNSHSAQNQSLQSLNQSVVLPEPVEGLLQGKEYVDFLFLQLQDLRRKYEGLEEELENLGVSYDQSNSHPVSNMHSYNNVSHDSARGVAEGAVGGFNDDMSRDNSRRKNNSSPKWTKFDSLLHSRNTGHSDCQRASPAQNSDVSDEEERFRDKMKKLFEAKAKLKQLQDVLAVLEQNRDSGEKLDDILPPQYLDLVESLESEKNSKGERDSRRSSCSNPNTMFKLLESPDQHFSNGPWYERSQNGYDLHHSLASNTKSSIPSDDRDNIKGFTSTINKLRHFIEGANDKGAKIKSNRKHPAINGGNHNLDSSLSEPDDNENSQHNIRKQCCNCESHAKKWSNFKESHSTAKNVKPKNDLSTSNCGDKGLRNRGKVNSNINESLQLPNNLSYSWNNQLPSQNTAPEMDGGGIAAQQSLLGLSHCYQWLYLQQRDIAHLQHQIQQLSSSPSLCLHSPLLNNQLINNTPIPSSNLNNSGPSHSLNLGSDLGASAIAGSNLKFCDKFCLEEADSANVSSVRKKDSVGKHANEVAARMEKKQVNKLFSSDLYLGGESGDPVGWNILLNPEGNVTNRLEAAYQEAALFIAQNECRLHYAITILKELSQLGTEQQRHDALNYLHSLNAAPRQFEDASNKMRNLVTVKTMEDKKNLGAIPKNASRQKSTLLCNKEEPNNTQSAGCGNLSHIMTTNDRRSLSTSKQERIQPQVIKNNLDVQKNVVSTTLDCDSHTEGDSRNSIMSADVQAVQSILVKLLPILNTCFDDVLTSGIISEIMESIVNVIARHHSANVTPQLVRSTMYSSVQPILERYTGRKVNEVRDELLYSLREVLHYEWNMLRIRHSDPPQSSSSRGKQMNNVAELEPRTRNTPSPGFIGCQVTSSSHPVVKNQQSLTVDQESVEDNQDLAEADQSQGSAAETEVEAAAAMIAPTADPEDEVISIRVGSELGLDEVPTRLVTLSSNLNSSTGSLDEAATEAVDTESRLAL